MTSPSSNANGPPFEIEELQDALLSDTGVAFEAEQLRNVLTESWLLRSGSPYPQDDIPVGNGREKFRFVCYRWLAYWAIQSMAAFGAGGNSGERLSFQRTRPLVHKRWPDSGI